MLKGFKSGGRILRISTRFFYFYPKCSTMCPKHSFNLLCVRHILQNWHYSHREPWEDCLCHCSLSDTDQSRRAFQVRNLCYMVTRRERMKHTLCDLQEKIFHLQIQLLEEDIAGGETQPFYYTFIYLFCFLHNLLQSRGRCTRGRQHSRFHHKRGVER